MACPLNRNRWKGSGYTKEDANTTTSNELSEKMKRMMEERTKQDAQLFPHNADSKKVESHTIVKKNVSGSVHTRSNV